MTGAEDRLRQVSDGLAPHGIHLRGVVNFELGEGPLLAGGDPALSVVLLGNVGGSIWPSFEAWLKTYEGPHPLDEWSKATVRPVAEQVGAEAFFPSDPPWQPFQQWATKAEGLRTSPLGMLIYPTYGLWHGYRAALAFGGRLDASAQVSSRPCAACVSRPCLSFCPAGAVRAEGFVPGKCRAHLESSMGEASCIATGCHSRNACPVGAGYRYPPEQLQFHMGALLP
jgi:hypothetical protein